MMEKKKERAFFQKRDLAIIGGLLLSGLLIWLLGTASREDAKAVRAEIYYGSELAMAVNLEKGVERVFSIPQEPDVVFHQYPDGTICFEHSDCPDQVCVHAGRLGRAGQSTACLPNRVILKLVPDGGHSGDDPDMVQR